MKQSSDDDDPPPSRDQIEELERLEQETTLVLQDIDRNLARANSIITNRILPKVKGYAHECDRVWSNVGFWKHFFEQSANVVLDSDGGFMSEKNANPTNLNMFNDTMKLLAGHVDPTPDSMQSLLMEPIPAQPSNDQPNPMKKPILMTNTNPVVDSTPTWSTNLGNNRYLSSTPQPPASKDQSNLNPQSLNDDSTGSLHMPPLLSEAVTKALSSPNRISALKDHQAVPLVQTENFLSPQRVPGDPLLESSPSFPIKPTLVSHYPGLDDEDENNDNGKTDELGLQERSFSPPPQLTLTIYNVHPQQEHQPGSSPTRFDDGSFSPIPLPPHLSPTKPSDAITAVTELEIQVPSLLNEVRMPELQTDHLDWKRLLEDPQPNAKKARRAFDTANEDDNVFLEGALLCKENDRSVNETSFHSIPDHGPDHASTSKEKTSESISQSHSMSRLFDAAVLSASKDLSDKPMVEARNMFSNLSESFGDHSNTDHTGDSTNDLLPEYREKFKQLTASLRKRS